MEHKITQKTMQFLSSHNKDIILKIDIVDSFRNFEDDLKINHHKRIPNIRHERIEGIEFNENDDGFVYWGYGNAAKLGKVTYLALKFLDRQENKSSDFLTFLKKMYPQNQSILVAPVKSQKVKTEELLKQINKALIQKEIPVRISVSLNTISIIART